MSNKVLIIADSSALPGHLNNYEDTWVYKFKYLHPEFDVITYLQRALTSDILVNQGGGDQIDKLPRGADTLEFYIPDYVIIQLGIVDCAPRLFNNRKLSTKLLERLPKKIVDLVYNIKLKYWGRNIKNAYVSPQKFEFNFRNYIKRAKTIGVKKIILIAICHPTNEMVAKNPSILKFVQIYNSILNIVCSNNNIALLINPLDSRQTSQTIFQDGYHPNRLGHDRVIQHIQKVINE